MKTELVGSTSMDNVFVSVLFTEILLAHSFAAYKLHGSSDSLKEPSPTLPAFFSDNQFNIISYRTFRGPNLGHI